MGFSARTPAREPFPPAFSRSVGALGQPQFTLELLARCDALFERHELSHCDL